MQQRHLPAVTGTRWLGGYHADRQTDPASMTRLMKGLDEFLDRDQDQDRALFDLEPRTKDA